MKNGKYSLYIALGLIIISTVTIIMSINSTYRYVTTKDKTIEEMKESSKKTIISLKNNVKNLIASYAINEYDNLILNEIKRRDIFAIVVKDHNMGKILGQESYVSGKIRDENNQIVDYNPTAEFHNEQLKNCFYTDSYDIASLSGEKLGNISIYISDESMRKELNKIIIDNIKNSLLLSFLLIISLFITIRLFILKPISDIVETITCSDKDGIPLKLIENNPFTEINALISSINKMIHSIRKSNKQLKKDQTRLEYLLELSPIAVRIARDRGKSVIFANNAYSKLLHMNKKQTISKNPRDYYTHKEFYDGIVKKLDNDEIIYNELVELDIDGDKVWALASYMNIDFDGEKAVIGWFYDVTTEKNNEAILHQALELQTTIFDNSGYLMIRTDTNGMIKQINKEAEKLLGYAAEELIDKHTPAIFHLEDETLKRAQEFSTELNCKVEVGFEVFIIKSKQGLINEHEWTYVTKDGRHIPVMLAVTPLKNKDNNIYGYLGIAKDVTQSKLIESQSKLASMGEMIGNIAHQWRQPLSAISTIASGVHVKSEFGQLNEEELLEDMDHITEQSQYLSKTIDDFRDFIKNTNIKEDIRAHDVIKKALSITSSSIKDYNISLQLELEDDILLQGYGNQLIQAIINILNNAKDAISENIQNDDERFIFIATKKKNNQFILTIKDNGGGIPENIIQNIFEPYFTTKHKSIGTGIGLSMAYQIITEHHNAMIRVSNKIFEFHQKEYKGACFEILFDV